MSKVVVITGASSGLGKALVKEYLKRLGYTLIISGRNKQKLQEFENIPSVKIVYGDLTEQATRNALCKIVSSEYNTIDILINNAAINFIQPFEQTTQSQLDILIDTNLNAPIALTQQLYPLMIRKQKGTIININSSIVVKGGRANYVLYSASKFGLEGFTQALREEAKQYNIKIISIYPGGMKTSLHDNMKLPTNLDITDYMDPQKVAETIVSLSEKDGISIDEIVINRI